MTFPSEDDLVHPYELAADEQDLVLQVHKATEGLPIIERLRMARNLVFNRDGDTANIPERPQCASSHLVVRTIDDVIEILERHPRSANLRHPER